MAKKFYVIFVEHAMQRNAMEQMNPGGGGKSIYALEGKDGEIKQIGLTPGHYSEPFDSREEAVSVAEALQAEHQEFLDQHNPDCNYRATAQIYEVSYVKKISSRDEKKKLDFKVRKTEAEIQREKLTDRQKAILEKRAESKENVKEEEKEDGKN